MKSSRIKWPWQRHCPIDERLLVHKRDLWPAALSVNGRSIRVDALARAMSSQLLTFELPFLVYSAYWKQTELSALKSEIFFSRDVSLTTAFV